MGERVAMDDAKQKIVEDYLNSHDVYNPQPLGYDLSKVMLLKKQYGCSLDKIPADAIDDCKIYNIVVGNVHRPK